MKKILLPLLFATFLSAAEIAWKHDLKSAAEAAEANNKKVMILMSSESCRYCRQMHREVFANDAIAEYINKHFVALELDINKDAYPDALDVRGVPATFFFSSDLKTRYEKLLGPRHPMMFMHILQAVAKE
jgi:thioredoxin-related protein